jgi:hypothetical protein
MGDLQSLGSLGGRQVKGRPRDGRIGRASEHSSKEHMQKREPSVAYVRGNFGREEEVNEGARK